MASSSGQYIPLVLKPGINKNSTVYAAEGEYVDCDKVRFFNGLPEKIGGWQKQNISGSISGVFRNMHAWSDLNGKPYLALGGSEKLLIMQSGRYYDLTPVTHSYVPTIATTVSSSTVDVTYASAHDAQVGDWLEFPSTVTVGGLSLLGQYQITAVGSATTLSFNAGSNATSTASTTGTVNNLLQNGSVSNSYAYGFGAGTYGTGTYGTPRGTGVATRLRTWSLDNWGKDLVANPFNGAVYLWVCASPITTRATKITQAPSQSLFTLVTRPVPHMVCFGCSDALGTFDPLLIRWCTQEDYTNWTPSTTNTAGDFRLSAGTQIVAVCQTRKEILVFTDDAVFAMRYVGGDLVFEFEILSNTGVSIAGPNAVIDIDGRVMWMAQGDLFLYDGYVRPFGSACTVAKDIFEEDATNEINWEQREKISCGVNRKFNEVTFFLPRKADGITSENSRYVTYNFVENVFYDGSMNRTAWVDSCIFEKPYAIDQNNNLFVHEQGSDDDATKMYSWLLSAPYDIGEGDKVMFADQFIPDFRINQPINVTIKTRKFPQADFVIKGAFQVRPTTKKISLRARGRQMQLLYESNETGAYWRIGRNRLSVQEDGER